MQGVRMTLFVLLMEWMFPRPTADGNASVHEAAPRTAEECGQVDSVDGVYAREIASIQPANQQRDLPSNFIAIRPYKQTC